MSTIEAQAPGKLVICGEYAVLEGAPAIAVAVDVKAIARVCVASAGELSVAGASAWPFEWNAEGRPRWISEPPGDAGRILAAVAATLADAGHAPAGPQRIELDSLAFQAQPAVGRAAEKLGLGSSAAITAALTAALLSLRGAEASELLGLAIAAHRRFQGGAGSGIDVATAVAGGVIALEAAGTLAPRRLSWPAQLHWLAVWSGRGASTTALLARLEAFRAREAAQCARHMAKLRAVAVAALAAWERGVAGEVLKALAAYRDCLAGLDAAAGIGIITPAHRELAACAAAQGAVYKTSGAGGGDFGLAFAESPAAIARLATDYAARGARTLAGRADVPGVTLVR